MLDDCSAGPFLTNNIAWEERSLTDRASRRGSLQECSTDSFGRDKCLKQSARDCRSGTWLSRALSVYDLVHFGISYEYEAVPPLPRGIYRCTGGYSLSWIPSGSPGLAWSNGLCDLFYSCRSWVLSLKSLKLEHSQCLTRSKRSRGCRAQEAPYPPSLRTARTNPPGRYDV